MIQTKEIVVNMGPQHPATHGVFRIKLFLDGEVIVKAEPIIGYLHRGIEKLAEYRTYTQFTPIVDRLDYVSAPGVSIGWVEAIEKLMGIEVPQRAKYIRVILAELARIASHLTWLGTHALDIGVMTLVFYCFREREYILDIFEMFCGARLTTNCFRIGGLLADIPEGFIEKTREFCKRFPKYLDDYHKLLTSNQIWLKRTRNVGIVSKEDAIDFGLSGPNIRGSGIGYDVRKAKPYSVYPEFDFIIPTGKIGDVYDRYLVRMEEMRQSTRIIEQAINSLPPGEIRTKVPRVIKPPPGEVYHSVETPRGELGFYVVSDGSTNPYRVRIRPPTFINLSAVATILTGHLVADAVAIIGSLDPVMGEVDR